ncbi:MAG: aromatic ring-hydroxylating dioxygenase subunit alpha [Emcibacteraceae bacterium]|nr:aromatic ring-hydroxylating dioxygenase subunit alpha [Emcibacteraceae bacterium]MDG1857527.1 aromatic ring-hydroxylating dioxygenase subunit alpha [Emcibacteraceae bacterium]
MTVPEGIKPGKGIEMTLPSDWYLSEEIFKLEREHIFLKEWYCIGRDDQWPTNGDHKIIDVMGESIILLRNTEGVLKGVYNVCVHRGSRICMTQADDIKKEVMPVQGGVVNKRMIICPYHAWTYDLDGNLINAPHMSTEMGFDKEKISLHPILVETFGGFVFVNMTPETALPFDEHIKSFKENFVRYPLADLRIGKTLQYEVDANWKVICENYNECYHCGPVHPELCKIVPVFKENGGSDLDWDRGVPHKEGADTFTLTGTTTRRAFPGLNEDEQVRHKGDLLYPNMFLSMAKDHVVAFIFKPDGPNKTLLDCHFLFEPYELDKPDFDGSDAVDFWDLVNKQDWNICERVQLGMSARVHERGIFSPMEDWNLDIRKYVLDRIEKFV